MDLLSSFNENSSPSADNLLDLSSLKNAPTANRISQSLDSTLAPHTLPIRSLILCPLVAGANRVNARHSFRPPPCTPRRNADITTAPVSTMKRLDSMTLWFERECEGEYRELPGRVLPHHERWDCAVSWVFSAGGWRLPTGVTIGDTKFSTALETLNGGRPNVRPTGWWRGILSLALGRRKWARRDHYAHVLRVAKRIVRAEHFADRRQILDLMSMERRWMLSRMLSRIPIIYAFFHHSCIDASRVYWFVNRLIWIGSTNEFILLRF
jgi:hypothetical protein